MTGPMTDGEVRDLINALNVHLSAAEARIAKLEQRVAGLEGDTPQARTRCHARRQRRSWLPRRRGVVTP